MGSIRFCDNVNHWVQPPDAENRMSGGVGGVTGAIPLPRPDRILFFTRLNLMAVAPGVGGNPQPLQ
jgi:hypothetical protein